MLLHGQIVNYSDLDPTVNIFKPQVIGQHMPKSETSNPKKDTKENTEWKQVKKHTKTRPKIVETKVVNNGR